MTSVGETFLDGRRVRMRVVDVKKGRRGRVVFCRDERGREHRVSERTLASWTAVRPRFCEADEHQSSLVIHVPGSAIACSVDDAPGLRVVCGFDQAARLLGFQAEPDAATLAVVAGTDWAQNSEAQRSVVAGGMWPAFELVGGDVVQLQSAVLAITTPGTTHA